MNRRQIEWLNREIDTWVEENLLGADLAARLRERYASQPPARSWAVAIFAILGGLLIGTGIITLLAYNWNELGRGLRTVIALLPLLTAQGLAGYACFSPERRKSLAWREGVGMFWVLAVGAALSLIWQTYHLPSPWQDFFLLWTLLSLPVAFLLRSLAALFFYLLSLCIWGLSMIEVSLSHPEHILLWALYVLACPLLVRARLKKPDSARTAFAALLFALAGGMALIISLTQVTSISGASVSIAIALAGAIYVGLSLLGFPARLPLWKKPFLVLGRLTIIILALVLSFGMNWNRDFDFPLFPHGALLVTWLGLATAVARQHRLGDTANWLHLGFPLLLGIEIMVNAEEMGTIIHNLFLLALGVLYVRDGVTSLSLARMNWGLTIVAILVIVRLFDSSIGFTTKGLAFIMVGTAFLAINVAVARRRNQAQSSTSPPADPNPPPPPSLVP